MSQHDDVRADAAALQAILTAIQVSLAELRGDVSTLNARLEGRLDAHAAEQARLDTAIQALKKETEAELHDGQVERRELAADVTDLKTWRTKLVAVAAAVAAVVSLGGQLWPILNN